MRDPLSAAPPRAGEPERAEYLRTQIAGITKLLSGPNVPNLERRLLHEDRKDMRAELATLTAVPPTRPAPDPTEEHNG